MLRRHLIAVLGCLLVALCARGAEKSKYADVSAALNTTALQPGQQAVLAVVFDVKDGFHAQSHDAKEPNIKFELTLDDNPAITPGAVVYPKGEDHVYGALGTLNVYTGRVIAYVPVTVKADAKPGELKVTGSVTFQACDNNQCYLPQNPKFELTTKVVAAGEPTQLNQPELFKGFDPKAVPHDAPATSQPAKKSAAAFTFFGHEIGAGGSRVAVFGVALIIGLIFNVMPCVLPVLPLKILGFYETSRHNRGRSFLLGTIFSLGVVATFAVLASLVLFGGKQWGQMFSVPWFVWTLVVVLVLVALSQFGLFTFRLPMGVYTINPSHETLSGNFLSGIFAAILSTPCTAPIFPGLLAWALLQPRAIGVAAVVMVGVGMALPYLVLSALPEVARKLPRSGPWSAMVKQMMGFLLLGVAVYFAGPMVLGGLKFMWIVFALVVVAGVFLVVRTAQLMPRVRPVLVSGVVAVLLVGATFQITRALTRTTGPAWQAYSPQALAEARQEHKVVLVKFTADWCATCQYVESTVYPDPATLKAIDQHHVVMLKADLTSNSAAGWPLLRELNPSGGIPLTAIYAPSSPEPALLASIYTRQTLVDTLDRVAPVR